MNSEKKIEELLTQHLPLASQEEVDADCDRVWQRLQLRSRTSPQEASAALPARRVFAWRRAAVLAAAAALVLAILAIRNPKEKIYATVETSDSAISRISATEHALKSGDTIRIGDVVRSTGPRSAVLSLTDGSRLEMRAQTEFSVHQASDGIRIHLRKGGLIINAAKQLAGHLYVQTKDVVVSVVGTVFMVNAEEEGSRVAVIEGEVRVQQGETTRSLKPGQQLASNPKMEQLPVEDELAWSRSLEAHVALLQQTTAAQNREPVERFEVAVVRFSDRPREPAGSRGGGPGDAPCEGPFGPQVQLNPRRFDADEATLFALIAWAYGKNCGNAVRADLITGGPGWVRSDRFAVHAVILEGSPIYTRQEFLDGRAPKLQAMLQTFLADRFALSLRSETKEISALALRVSKDPHKLTLSREGGRKSLGTALRSDLNGQPFATLVARKTSMEELANGLSLTTRRMVVDETGLAGEFNFDIDYGSVDVGTASGPSIFSALQEQLGLKLESTRVRTEVLQIERAERPTDAAFEVESVRPRPELVARENGRGGPIGGEKCSGRVQADPGRFSITNASIYQLVTLAYGLDPNGLSAGRCLNVTRMGLLSGGPAWVETARFDIEARIPPDSVGDANLQKMLQGLLRERFKLSLRREMKEMPVYVMSVAAGGPRLVSWREGDPASGGAFGLGSDGVAFIAGTRMSTEQLASRLATATNRPVFNRTDVKGEFKFTIRFEPTTDYFTTVVASAMPRPETAANPVNAPTLFSVLQDQLGLRLSAAREKVEVFVIDRVDRPSEN